MNTAMSPDYAGDQLFIPNIVRAIGQAMVLTPLSSVTTGDLAPQDAAAASGISNMLRNLGGAIGTAAYGQEGLADALEPNDQPVLEALSAPGRGCL